MKIGTIRKFYTRLLQRRNKAQREYRKHHPSTLNMARVRADAEVTTLDHVLDDLDRLIARNHDRFHDRRKKRA